MTDSKEDQQEAEALEVPTLEGEYTVKRVAEWTPGKHYSVAAVECDSDVVRFFTVSHSGMLSVHRATKEQLREEHFVLPLESSETLATTWVMSVAVSPSCKYYADGGLNNLVSLWDFATHRVVSTEERAEGYISQVSFISDNFIAVTVGTGTVLISEIVETTTAPPTFEPLLSLNIATMDLMSVATRCMDDSTSVLCVFGGVDTHVYGLYLDSWLCQTEPGSGELRRTEHRGIEDGSVELGRDYFDAELSFGNADEDVNRVSISTGNNARFVALCSDDCNLRVYKRGADTQIRNSSGDLLKHPCFELLASFREDGLHTACVWVSASRVVVVGDCTNATTNTAHIVDFEDDTVNYLGLAVELLSDGYLQEFAATLVQSLANEIFSFLPPEVAHWQLPLGSEGSRLSCVSRYCDNGFVICSWDRTLYIAVPKKL